jgi:hypothetical protein
MATPTSDWELPGRLEYRDSRTAKDYIFERSICWPTGDCGDASKDIQILTPTQDRVSAREAGLGLGRNKELASGRSRRARIGQGKQTGLREGQAALELIR